MKAIKSIGHTVFHFKKQIFITVFAIILVFTGFVGYDTMQLRKVNDDVKAELASVIELGEDFKLPEIVPIEAKDMYKSFLKSVMLKNDYTLKTVEKIKHHEYRITVEVNSTNVNNVIKDKELIKTFLATIMGSMITNESEDPDLSSLVSAFDVYLDSAVKLLNKPSIKGTYTFKVQYNNETKSYEILSSNLVDVLAGFSNKDFENEFNSSLEAASIEILHNNSKILDTPETEDSAVE